MSSVIREKIINTLVEKKYIVLLLSGVIIPSSFGASSWALLSLGVASGVSSPRYIVMGR